MARSWMSGLALALRVLCRRISGVLTAHNLLPRKFYRWRRLAEARRHHFTMTRGLHPDFNRNRLP